VINVPVMKTHSQLGISGGVESLIRAVDEYTQKKMFEENIEKKLPELVHAMPQFLTIGDATIGLEGDGPTLLGEPAFLNMILLSKNVMALDKVFAEIGMLSAPKYLRQMEDIEIVGDEIEACKFQMKAAKSVTSHPKIKLIDGKANPLIHNSALQVSSKLFGLLGHELNLVIGRHLTEEMVSKSRLVAYGNDAIQKLKTLGVQTVAEIPEDIDDVEKLMLLKSVLVDPDKKGINIKDRVKSKIAKFGMKIKSL